MLMPRSRLSFEDRKETKVSRYYIAASGTEITEEMIDIWREAYKKGELPEGDHFHGPVFMVCLRTQTKSLQFFKSSYSKV